LSPITAACFDEETMSTASHQPGLGNPTRPAAAHSTRGGQEQIMAVADTLAASYGLQPVDITRLQEYTGTDNYAVADQTGRRHVAKVYRDRNSLTSELASIELSEFAADAGVPTARVAPTVNHELIETHGAVPMSLWAYVPHTETAEGTLTGARWAAVGTALGRLHSTLASHPAAAPTLEPGGRVRDVAGAHHRFESLIRAYEDRPSLGEFEAWALQAARKQQALLGDVERILASLPRLTVQVMHGDMAGPNVLLRDDDIAAFVDFSPPTPGYLAWEIVRIGCDPMSFLANGVDRWLQGYTDLALAYRDANPKGLTDDLLCSLRVGCAAVLCHTFPLSAPVERPHIVTAALEAYARARHEAALMLLDRLPVVEQALRDSLR
jgi:Ser/Thr protein kinase RdoA (MazF antagonist)